MNLYKNCNFFHFFQMTLFIIRGSWFLGTDLCIIVSVKLGFSSVIVGAILNSPSLFSISLQTFCELLSSSSYDVVLYTKKTFIAFVSFEMVLIQLLHSIFYHIIYKTHRIDFNQHFHRNCYQYEKWSLIIFCFFFIEISMTNNNDYTPSWLLTVLFTFLQFLNFASIPIAGKGFFLKKCSLKNTFDHPSLTNTQL